MLLPAPHIRYHIAAILAVPWLQFVVQYKGWVKAIVFENVRKVLACHTYKNIHGRIVKIHPKTLDPNTEVMRF